MIVCKSCGFHNKETDAFCGSCGAFLEWTGEKLKPVAVPVVEEEVVDEQPKRGFFSKLQSALYLDVGDRDPVPQTTRPGAPGAPGAGPRPPGAAPGPPGAGPPRPPGAPEIGRASCRERV